MLVLQNTPPATAEFGGLRAEHRVVPLDAAKFDLTFDLTETAAEGIAGTVTYATDLFDRTTAERVADLLARALSAFAARPDVSLSRADLIAPGERTSILGAWSGGRDDGAGSCLHEVVATQA
ncbi:condensation domain-containing protein, partial [Streptomyces sp. Tu 4128]